ncbi:MAG: DUF5106 domain-containing protein [Chitinophagaceae bacterium]|nr:DUF5106 domain-containing protein [Chitinophagaceae bacterium]
MKRVFGLIAGFFFCINSIHAQADSGYEIKVTFKPFTNQYIYLGHYFGKSYPIVDSAMLNEKSEAVFKGPEYLNGGIYLIGYPNKTGFFEILIDKQQHFSVIADTATLKNKIEFKNSPDNVLFLQYQHYMEAKGGKIDSLRKIYKATTSKKDSLAIRKKLETLDSDISSYRSDFIKKYPNSMLTAFFQCMKEPVLTGRLKDPKNKKDSIDSWYYYKEHYWDGVSFYDSRLAYTTFFEDKLNKYFNEIVSMRPDSVIQEMDWMLGTASINPEMTRYLLIRFVNRYLNQKYMWEDAVFLHLFENYFAHKEYSWLSAGGKKMITDRAYSLMANIMGDPAADILLPDSTGNMKALYEDSAKFTVVIFWDPMCGHCKEILPKIDSIYQHKWKAEGVSIYSVAKETDGTQKDWLNFISEHHIEGWTQVYYSKEADKARTDNNIPGYSQLYDVLSFPTIYLLDKEKRIIAKKLTFEQIDDILQLKLKKE